MMDSPFYRAYNSYKDLPSRPRARQAPTVKEIPVHFVASERREIRSENRSESAVKIQRVFRGFLVRKSVKKIAEIRAEVEEIERRISEKESIESIGRDSQARLRVNETLMNLLFKLDSVRGVDSGVRDFRKAVIKRNIALQEILDSIVVNNNSNNNLDRTAVDDVVVDQTAVEEEKCTEEDGENHDSEEICPNCDAMPSSVSDCRLENSQTESQSGSSSVNPESLVQACEENDDAASSLKQEGDRIEDKGENVKESEEEEESVRMNKREMLFERMVEENEKMMGLMTQLFEKNEIQTRLLSSLSQRVEQLERAFLCDRSRRKKKRRQGAAAAVGATVEGCDLSPNVKKCGKR